MGKKAKIRRRKRCLVTRRIGESLLCILATSYPVNTVRKQYFVSSTIIVLMNY